MPGENNRSLDESLWLTVAEWVLAFLKLLTAVTAGIDAILQCLCSIICRILRGIPQTIQAILLYLCRHLEERRRTFALNAVDSIQPVDDNCCIGSTVTISHSSSTQSAWFLQNSSLQKASLIIINYPEIAYCNRLLLQSYFCDYLSTGSDSKALKMHFDARVLYFTLLLCQELEERISKTPIGYLSKTKRVYYEKLAVMKRRCLNTLNSSFGGILLQIYIIQWCHFKKYSTRRGDVAHNVSDELRPDVFVNIGSSVESFNKNQASVNLATLSKNAKEISFIRDNTESSIVVIRSNSSDLQNKQDIGMRMCFTNKMAHSSENESMRTRLDEGYSNEIPFNASIPNNLNNSKAKTDLAGVKLEIYQLNFFETISNAIEKGNEKVEDSTHSYANQNKTYVTSGSFVAKGISSLQKTNKIYSPRELLSDVKEFDKLDCQSKNIGENRKNFEETEIGKILSNHSYNFKEFFLEHSLEEYCYVKIPESSTFANGFRLSKSTKIPINKIVIDVKDEKSLSLLIPPRKYFSDEFEQLKTLIHFALLEEIVISATEQQWRRYSFAYFERVYENNRDKNEHISVLIGLLNFLLDFCNDYFGIEQQEYELSFYCPLTEKYVLNRHYAVGFDRIVEFSYKKYETKSNSIPFYSWELPGPGISLDYNETPVTCSDGNSNAFQEYNDNLKTRKVYKLPPWPQRMYLEEIALMGEDVQILPVLPNENLGTNVLDTTILTLPKKNCLQYSRKSNIDTELSRIERYFKCKAKRLSTLHRNETHFGDSAAEQTFSKSERKGESKEETNIKEILYTKAKHNNKQKKGTIQKTVGRDAAYRQKLKDFINKKKLLVNKESDRQIKEDTLINEENPQKAGKNCYPATSKENNCMQDSGKGNNDCNKQITVKKRNDSKQNQIATVPDDVISNRQSKAPDEISRPKAKENKKQTKQNYVSSVTQFSPEATCESTSKQSLQEDSTQRPSECANDKNLVEASQTVQLANEATIKSTAPEIKYNSNLYISASTSQCLTKTGQSLTKEEKKLLKKQNKMAQRKLNGVCPVTQHSHEDGHQTLPEATCENNSSIPASASTSQDFVNIGQRLTKKEKKLQKKQIKMAQRKLNGVCPVTQLSHEDGHQTLPEATCENNSSFPASASTNQGLAKTRLCLTKKERLLQKKQNKNAQTKQNDACPETQLSHEHGCRMLPEESCASSELVNVCVNGKNRFGASQTYQLANETAIKSTSKTTETKQNSSLPASPSTNLSLAKTGQLLTKKEWKLKKNQNGKALTKQNDVCPATQLSHEDGHPKTEQRSTKKETEREKKTNKKSQTKNDDSEISFSRQDTHQTLPEAFRDSGSKQSLQRLQSLESYSKVVSTLKQTTNSCTTISTTSASVDVTTISTTKSSSIDATPIQCTNTVKAQVVQESKNPLNNRCTAEVGEKLLLNRGDSGINKYSATINPVAASRKILPDGRIDHNIRWRRATEKNITKTWVRQETMNFQSNRSIHEGKLSLNCGKWGVPEFSANPALVGRRIFPGDHPQNVRRKHPTERVAHKDRRILPDEETIKRVKMLVQQNLNRAVSSTSSDSSDH